MILSIKYANRVKKVLDKLHKNKKLFSSLFFDERLINKKYFTKKQINILKSANLISVKGEYIYANFRAIKLEIKNHSAFIVTDKVSYKRFDQVMPLHPENQFLIDDIKIKKGDEVLEIGVGSGVNVVFAILFEAKKVIALDINKRTLSFTKFNLALNLPRKYQNRVKLILNKRVNLESIFEPVKNIKFNYIITNPPFEPTPPKSDYLLNSSGGIYGLDVIEAILKKVKLFLRKEGHFQMVTFSPGNKKDPFMLKNLLMKYLGAGIIHLNKSKIKYKSFTKRFIDLGYSKEKILAMNKKAEEDKVSYLFLSMVHYNNSMKEIKCIKSKEIYRNWDIPIYSDVPMGLRPKRSYLKFE